MKAPTKKGQATPESKMALTFTDAAEKILREARKPLTHKQLAQKSIAEELVQTESETPEISMHVSIRSEMKRRELRGELGRGCWRLWGVRDGALSGERLTNCAHGRIYEGGYCNACGLARRPGSARHRRGAFRRRAVSTGVVIGRQSRSLGSATNS